MTNYKKGKHKILNYVNLLHGFLFKSFLIQRLHVFNFSDKDYDYDFLSSIELLILDHSEVFLMQNWEYMMVRTNLI